MHTGALSHVLCHLGRHRKVGWYAVRHNQVAFTCLKIRKISQKLFGIARIINLHKWSAQGKIVVKFCLKRGDRIGIMEQQIERLVRVRAHRTGNARRLTARDKQGAAVYIITDFRIKIRLNLT